MSTNQPRMFEVRCTRQMFANGKPVAVGEVVSVGWTDALVIIGAKRGELVTPADFADIKRSNEAHNLSVFNEGRRFAAMTGRLQAFFNS